MRLALRRLKIAFRQQWPIGPYRADFYLPGLRLVIECDGKAWHTLPHQRRRDKRRDAYMRAEGYRVARLTGSEIYRGADAAVARALRKGARSNVRQAIPLVTAPKRAVLRPPGAEV